MQIANSAALTDTRLQLHWAAQLQCAAADATLEHTDDDGHANLEWDTENATLRGRSGVLIDVPNFVLSVANESLPLASQTLDDALQWLAQRLNTQLAFRDYDMPDHPVRAGQPLNPDTGQLAEIARWFTFAHDILQPQGELRVWPHHFDMGFWISLEQEGADIGGGFTMGDHYYDEPYFYVNPYGMERPDHLPALDAGHWTNSWFGAVLAAQEMGDADQASEVANRFIESATNASRELMTA